MRLPLAVVAALISVPVTPALGATPPATGFYEVDREEAPPVSVEVRNENGSRTVTNLLLPLPGCATIAADLRNFGGSYTVGRAGRFTGSEAGLQVSGRFAKRGHAARIVARTDNAGCVATRRYILRRVIRRPVPDGEFLALAAREPADPEVFQDPYVLFQDPYELVLTVTHGGRLVAGARFTDGACFETGPGFDDVPRTDFPITGPIEPDGDFEATYFGGRLMNLYATFRGGNVAGIAHLLIPRRLNRPQPDGSTPEPTTSLCNSGELSFVGSSSP
jgi:hypothetical protein